MRRVIFAGVLLLTIVRLPGGHCSANVNDDDGDVVSRNRQNTIRTSNRRGSSVRRVSETDAMDRDDDDDVGNRQRVNTGSNQRVITRNEESDRSDDGDVSNRRVNSGSNRRLMTEAEDRNDVGSRRRLNPGSTNNHRRVITDAEHIDRNDDVDDNDVSGDRRAHSDSRHRVFTRTDDEDNVVDNRRVITASEDRNDDVDSRRRVNTGASQQRVITRTETASRNDDVVIDQRVILDPGATMTGEASAALQREAISVIRASKTRHNDELERAIYIRDYFQQKYGSGWTVIIGANCAMVTTFVRDHYIVYTLSNGLRYVIWKNGSGPSSIDVD